MSLLLGGGVLFLLAWVPLAGLVWYVYGRTRPAVSRGRTAVLAGLRAAAVGLLLVLLAEPVVERSYRSLVRPGILVLVDTSASMALVDSDSTRLQRALEALQPGGLLGELSATADVDLWQFGSMAARVAADSLDRLQAQDRSTDVSGALRAALEQGQRRADMAAVVLISDGQHNLGPSPIEAAAACGLPVYGLSVGGAAPPADVQITAVRPPAVAYVGQGAAIGVDVRAWGYGGRSVTVELDENGEPLARTDVVLGADGQTVQGSLALRSTRPGTHVYRVFVRPSAGEAAADNNEALVPLDVREDRIGVLLLAAAPSADLAFLRRALTADSSLAVQVRADLSRLGADGRLAQVRASVQASQAVAVVDPGPGLLQEAVIGALGDWVQAGGGLLWVFGPHTLAAWAQRPLAVPWLPVELPGRPVWSPGPFAVSMAPAGRSHPIGRLPVDGSAADYWQGLPPLPGVVPATRLRDGAVTILQTAGGQGAPIVVAGPAGRGRVVAALSGGFWRQDLQSSGAGRNPGQARQFWVNVVRWLGTRQAGARLRVWSQKSVYRSGDRAGFEAQVTDGLLRPQEGAAVAVRVMPPDLLVPLADRGAGNYAAEWRGLEPGEYSFSATADVGGVTIGEDRGVFMVEPYSLESADVRADHDLMGRMARASGGVSVPLARWRELATLLPLQQRVESRRTRTGVWPHAWCLALVVALLTAEWVLRQRSGMI